MKSIYVFDMVGVILRPSDLKGVYDETKTTISYPEFRNIFYHSDLSDDVYKGYISDRVYFKSVADRINSTIKPHEFKSSYLRHKRGLYNEVVNLINSLKESGNSVYLLSNLKVVDYEYLSSHMDMSVFDKTYLSYELGLAKPNRDIYEYVINDLGTNEFYFFDDSSKNIESALSLGIDAHKVTGETLIKSFVRKVS